MTTAPPWIVIMTGTSRPFDETRKALLQDPKTAALYLEEALEAGDTEALRRSPKPPTSTAKPSIEPYPNAATRPWKP